MRVIRGMAVLRAAGLIACASGMMLAGSAHAQNATTLIRPAIKADYTRDRNESVAERPHPDFDAIGMRFGSFIVNPSATLTIGASNNIYTDDSNKKSDTYAILAPYARVSSDWSNHQLSIEAAGEIRRQAKEKLRDQNGWYINGSGDVDVTSEFTIKAQGQLGRSYESPFSGDVATEATVLSNYLRKAATLTGTYSAGRGRMIVNYDITSFDFNTIRFADGSSRNQDFRNRVINRAAVQGEYALSPSVSLYTQINVDSTRYSVPFIATTAPLTSKGYSIIGGTSFDLAGVMRGSIGLGYSARNFQSPIFQDAKGLSMQAQAEFFPSPITTLTVAVQRQIQDSSLGSSSAFFDNRASVKVDHELLENLILTTNAAFVRQKSVTTGAYTDTVQYGASGRYQATRALSIAANVDYGQAVPNGTGVGRTYHEFRAGISIRIRR